jgi:hypothetical protein
LLQNVSKTASKNVLKTVLKTASKSVSKIKKKTALQIVLKTAKIITTSKASKTQNVSTCSISPLKEPNLCDDDADDSKSSVYSDASFSLCCLTVVD